MCMTQRTEERSVKRDYKSRMFTMISEYVCMVREYAKQMSIEEAVDKAIDTCIREDILRGFLERNRAEARAMSIYEYDQDEHIRLEREDAFEDGRKLGVQEGRELGVQEGHKLGEQELLISQVGKKLAKGKTPEVIADELEEDIQVIGQIVRELGDLRETLDEQKCNKAKCCIL